MSTLVVPLSSTGALTHDFVVAVDRQAGGAVARWQVHGRFQFGPAFRGRFAALNWGVCDAR